MCRRILAFCRGSAFPPASPSPAPRAPRMRSPASAARPLILCPPGGEAEAIGADAARRLAARRGPCSAAADRLGVERIGELIAMPRAPLQRRFGETLLARLDQALGRAAEPFDPIVPEEPPSVLLRFLEPIATAEAIAEAAARRCAGSFPLLGRSRASASAASS